MTSLLITEVFPPKTGGSGRWFWEVYRRLPRAEYVIAAGEDPGQEVFDRSHDLCVSRLPLTLPEWGPLSPRGVRGYLRALRPLSRLIRRHRVARVHCGRVFPEGVMALALKWWFGLPYVCYVHGEETSYTAQSRELHWLARRVVAKADYLIANCRNTARLVQEAWKTGPDRVRILHPGVDTERFRPAAADPAARARLGWTGRRVLLTVGRLQLRKGHDQMLLALRAVRRSIPDVLYAIAGAGEEEARLRRLTADEGLTDHVQFLGEPGDADLITCYQQCDLFVLPNRQVGKDIEGFGMVLLEAQACGKSVVAGASGGTVETMQIPDTGRVISCDGPDDLAALVADLLADEPLRARMGTAARRWVVEKFDWANLSRQAYALFHAGPKPTAMGPSANGRSPARRPGDAAALV
jgi:phosphatidyl-myo-inositol dimannoside synthase